MMGTSLKRFREFLQRTERMALLAFPMFDSHRCQRALKTGQQRAL